MSNLLRTFAKPLIRAVRQSGVQVNPISGRDHTLAGIKLQWRDDDPHTTRGAIVDAKINGRDIHFFIANESDLIQREHLDGKFYEEEELQIIARYFTGGVFVDVGSNVGNHLIYVLKMLNAETVIAFEPNPEALRILRINIALNALNERVILHALGLDAAPGRASVATPHNNLGAAHLARNGGHGEIELARGDDLLDTQKVDFIKIDTEGLELSVLEGLTNTIRQWRPTIFVEVDDRNQDVFRNFCRRAGYRAVESFKRYPINTNYLLKPASF